MSSRVWRPFGSSRSAAATAENHVTSPKEFDLGWDAGILPSGSTSRWIPEGEGGRTSTKVAADASADDHRLPRSRRRPAGSLS